MRTRFLGQDLGTSDGVGEAVGLAESVELGAVVEREVEAGIGLSVGIGVAVGAAMGVGEADAGLGEDGCGVWVGGGDEGIGAAWPAALMSRAEDTTLVGNSKAKKIRVTRID
jgi:hypothetical protein